MGDYVVCIDKKGAHKAYSLNCDIHCVIEISEFFDHIRVKENDKLLSIKRFKLALKNNKLNRKLYPNYKIQGEYLIKEKHE